jgi:hypothetical protein
MSRLVEIGDHNRAVEFDIREPLYKYVFRREGDAWVKERRAGFWELYEASLQFAIKEWRPCKQRITSDELERLLVLLMSCDGRPPWMIYRSARSSKRCTNFKSGAAQMIV